MASPPQQPEYVNNIRTSRSDAVSTPAVFPLSDRAALERELTTIRDMWGHATVFENAVFTLLQEGYTNSILSGVRACVRAIASGVSMECVVVWCCQMVAR